MKVGERVENFELRDQKGEIVRLADLVADGPAVLYFYIKAMTPG